MALISDEAHALLVQAGLVALDGGAVDEAEQILNGARMDRPDSPKTFIGLALAKFARKDFIGAVALLRDEALKANPQAEILRAFLGFALLKAGQTGEGQDILQKVVASSSDEQVLEFAKAAQEEELTPSR